MAAQPAHDRLGTLDERVRHLERGVFRLQGGAAVLVVIMAALFGSQVAIWQQVGSLERRVGEVETNLTAQIGGVKTELTAQIGGVETKLTGQIGGVETKLTGQIGSVRTELGREIESLRGDVRGLQAAIVQLRQDLLGELQRQRSGTDPGAGPPVPGPDRAPR